MSISSEITRISGNVSDALTAISSKGVTVPSGSNSDDLATLIGQISGGGGGSLVITDVSNTTGTTAEISVSGGGGSAQTETGTFTGGGGNTATISCSFAPDSIYIHGDLSSDPSLRGIITAQIFKDTYMLLTCDSSTSQAVENLLYSNYELSGYGTDTSYPYATYSNGTLTVDTVTNSGSWRWASGITYSYKLVKWTS